ncbi:MAG: hypothetical protein ABSD29_22965 [Verrucomicrobiota bacterium]|jgi:hypothetical protein
MPKKKKINLDTPKRGKCGTKVYQGGPHGQFCYGCFVSATPRTPLQVRGRDLWRAVSASWKTLPPAQQAVWIAVAAFHTPRAGSKVFLQANNIIDGWEDEPVQFTATVPP